MPEFLQLMEKEGIVLNDVNKPADWDKRVLEYIDLKSNKRGYSSHKWAYLLKEAMTTSDFPLLFGDVLQREILTAYKGVAPVWKDIVRPNTVPRIYPEIGGKRFRITGADQYLDPISQKGEYPASKLAEAKFDVYVRKYGRQFDISWETVINDDKGALRDIPTRFGLACARTEHRLVTAAFAGDIGTHAGGNLYQNTVNEDVLALTIANLQTCVTRMKSFVDDSGEPIENSPKFLVVGPALEWTALAILNSAVYQNVAGPIEDATTIIAPYPVANVIQKAGLTLVVDPYLPVLDASFPNSWYLFAKPTDIAALEFDRLEGHELPEICMKMSDKVALGGGVISPMEGDFISDNILYRVREVMGVNKLEWRATYCNHVA